MNRDVDSPNEKGLLDLTRKHSFAPGFAVRQRFGFRPLVASRPDHLDRYLQLGPGGPQRLLHQARLRQREIAAARPENHPARRAHSARDGVLLGPQQLRAVAPRVRRDHVLTREARRELRDYYGIAA